MKRLRKVLLLLVVLFLLLQIPFIYRRYRLGRLHAAIQQVNSQRRPVQDSNLIEYKGVVHVHSFLGGHSKGGFDEIISAAQSNQLDFVVMTEHTSDNFNTAAMTLKGKYGGTVFINGNEVLTATGDRLLLLPGDSMAMASGKLSTPEVLARHKTSLAFVAYPEEFKSWNAPGYTGVEVYNVYSNARKINPVLMFFDTMWSYGGDRGLLFATFYQRPAESLMYWDDAVTRKKEKLVAIAGNDSHANVGISLNDSSGKPLVGLQLDPYERSFRLVRLHVLIRPIHQELSEDGLLKAISAGNCFIGYDIFGDTSGFRFSAQNANQTRIMGDEIAFDGEVRLMVNLPVAGRIVLLKDGTTIKDDNGSNKMEFVARERGSYRVEVYPSQLPAPIRDQPWIISNPIYVR